MTKKNIKFLIALAGIAVLIVLCVIIKIEYDKCLLKNSELEQKFYFNAYELLYIGDNFSEYPQSDRQIIADMKLYFPKATDSIYCLNDIKKLDWQIDNNAHWHSYFLHNIDKFSDKKDVAIYFPLYNRHTKRRESFVILSAGIDGKQNNFLTDNDTLFMDNWQVKLKLYNPNHPYGNVCDSIIFFDKEGMVKFNIFNLFFGCKDQLLQVGRTDFTYSIKSEEEMAIIREKIDKILEERKKMD